MCTDVYSVGVGLMEVGMNNFLDYYITILQNANAK